MTLTLADVSEWQGTIDWKAYGQQNQAVIVRALYGANHVDKFWTQNLAGARANCKWRGFYQYLPASEDPAACANAFAKTVGTLLPGEVAILDLEEGTGDQTARRLIWLNTLHDAVEWTYSGLYFSRLHLPNVPIDWIAAYQSTAPSDFHHLWQNTDKETFAGISQPCDGSLFMGSLADLQLLTTIAPAPAPKPTPTPAPKPVNHNTGNQATEKPWGAFPLKDGGWYGVDDRSTATTTRLSHSGLDVSDQRAVKQVQREVHVTADGEFGSVQTLPAVMLFQAHHNLVRDGRVGPKTWNLMTQVD